MKSKYLITLVVGFVLGVGALSSYLRYGEWHGKHQVTETVANHVIELANLQRTLSEQGISKGQEELICTILINASEVSARASHEEIENWQVIELSERVAQDVKFKYPEAENRCGIPNT